MQNLEKSERRWSMMSEEYEEFDEVIEAAYDGEFESVEDLEYQAKAFEERLDGNIDAQSKYAVALAAVAEDGLANSIETFQEVATEVQDQMNYLASSHQQAVDVAGTWKENAETMQKLALGVAVKYADHVHNVSQAVDRLSEISEEIYEATDVTLSKPPTEGMEEMRTTGQNAIKALGLEDTEEVEILDSDSGDPVLPDSSGSE
jgi:formyltetrahydrofolate synthetase